MRKVKPFKAVGNDCIQGFFVKKIPAVCKVLRERVTEWINGKRDIPPWLVEGRTRLVPKTNPSSSDAKDYRPIAVLNAIYKVLTSTISHFVQGHCDLHKVVPVEQRALRKGRRGTHDCLLLDQALVQWTKVHRKCISVAWVDYRKAYDLVDWKVLTLILRTLKLPHPIVCCVERVLPLWKTSFRLKTATSEMKTSLVTYGRGLFQGDALSCILFQLSILPISNALAKCERFKGPSIDGFSNHLLFMDDLKVYSNSREGLEYMLKVVASSSEAIGME